MRLQISTILGIGLLSLLSACSQSSGGVASGSSDTATPAPETGSSEVAPATGQCPVGDWQVTTITGKSGAQINGVPVVAKSGAGFTLALTPDNTWMLAGNKAEVTLEAAGLTVAATVDGTASGDYVKTGDNYTFRQQRASGKATLKKPVSGVSSWPMDQVGPALAPGGQATLTCGAGTLRISSESVVLDLTGTGRAGGAPAPAPAPPATPPTTAGGPTGGSSGGPALELSDSTQVKTIDCGGRDVAVKGSMNNYTFTGSCGTVSVSGSKNTVKVAKAGVISVSGSFNTVTWSGGSPKTSNTGTGNTLRQG